MIIWCQNLGMSFMIWFTTGLPWFHGDDQRIGWEQLGVYFGAACSGDRRRERENTRPPENKKQGKETKNKKNKFGPPRNEKEKSPTQKREGEEKQRNSKRKKKEDMKRKEKRREANNLTPREKEEKKAWRKKEWEGICSFTFVIV